VPIDVNEPKRLAEAVKSLDLRYVVITSVTRDDLPDGGAGQFAAAIHAVQKTSPPATIEVLIPDFTGDLEALEKVVTASPAVISHNMETVQSLYATVRPGADYSCSLDLLGNIKRLDPEIRSKSGIMLGLGETRDEVHALFDDLLDVGCEFLTIGQYLSPSRGHLPVREYIEPERFIEYGETARNKGFKYVASAPFVRSSYHAYKLFT
jgi:lipoic acid synthetase